MSDVIRVIQYGLGPIGCATARLVHERENLELVGAVDIDFAKIGRDRQWINGQACDLRGSADRSMRSTTDRMQGGQR